jgi:aerobic carbon-monoxide dehydrogenase large subunit
LGCRHFASRAAVVAGSITYAAAKQVRAKILRTAAEHWECAEADLPLMNGKVMTKGVPQRNIALGALAALANPLRGAVQPGTEPGLEVTAYFGPAKGATAAGTHAMIVEIDPATMALRILKYVAAQDCGQ